MEQIEQAEARSTRWPKGEGETRSAELPRRLDRTAIKHVEKALNSRRAHFGQVTTGLDSINAKGRRPARFDLIILAGRPGMGKTSLATNIAFNAASAGCATGGRDRRSRRVGRGARPPSSAWK
jgi:replicative DNA helicase